MGFTVVRRSARLAERKFDYAISVTYGRTKVILDAFDRGEIPEGSEPVVDLLLVDLTAEQDAKCEFAYHFQWNVANGDV
jgi:hypothetical protein